VNHEGIAGLSLETTELHVVIRNVRILAGPGVDTINVTGFMFEDVRNVTVVNVTTVGTAHRAGIIEDSVVDFRGGRWSGVGDTRQAPIVLSVQNATIDVEDTVVEGGRTGVLLGRSLARFENVTVRNPIREGIGVLPPGSWSGNRTTHLVVQDSRLADPGYRGPGIELSACSIRARIVNTTFTGFFRQLDLRVDCANSPGRLVARGNTFRDASTGIMLDESGRRVLVVGNLFQNLNTGIRTSGQARIENNTFLANSYGMEYDHERDPGKPAPQTVRGNAFVRNDRYAVGGPPRLPLDATGNWWGTPDGPIVGDDPLPFEPRERVADGVRVEPWLTSPAENAPGAAALRLSDGVAPPVIGWDLWHDVEDVLAALVFGVLPAAGLAAAGYVGWRRLSGSHAS
jgi:hypothetical protein